VFLQLAPLACFSCAPGTELEHLPLSALPATFRVAKLAIASQSNPANAQHIPRA